MDCAGSAVGRFTRRPTMVSARKRRKSAAARASGEMASPISLNSDGSGRVFTTRSQSIRSSGPGEPFMRYGSVPPSSTDDGGHVEPGDERARAGFAAVVADALRHALADQAGPARRVEELDHQRRVAVLRAADLLAALAQRGLDHLPERDVRDAVLRERRGEMRRRHAPYLLRVGTEEEPVERPAHRLSDPVLRGDQLPRADLAADDLEQVVGEGADRD